MGAAGVRAESQVDWWVHKSLWVELGDRGAVRKGADGGLAVVRKQLLNWLVVVENGLMLAAEKWKDGWVGAEEVERHIRGG
ncbi:hypothetical protein AAC387_Pa01g3499 [Persea americana]